MVTNVTTTDDDDRVNIEQSASGRWTGRVLQYKRLEIKQKLKSLNFKISEAIDMSSSNLLKVLVVWTGCNFGGKTVWR